MRTLFSRIFGSIIITVLLVLAIVFASIYISSVQATNRWNEEIVSEFTSNLQTNLQFAEEQEDLGKSVVLTDVIVNSIEDTRISYLSFTDTEGNEVISMKRDPADEDDGAHPSKDMVPRGFDIPVMYAGNLMGTVTIGTFSPSAFKMTQDLFDKILTALISSILAAVVISTVLAVILSKNISKPISQISESLSMITRGNSTAEIRNISSIREIERITDDVRALQKEITDNERERSNWLKNIGHDLNTPVTALKVRIEGLLDGVFPPSEKMYAQMKRELLVLENRIHSFMDLSLLDSPDITISPSRIQSKPFLNGLLNAFSDLEERKSIEVQHKIEDFTFFADQFLLTKALDAVIENAFIYTPEGGEITATCYSGSRYIFFSIENTGRIPEDSIPSLFKDLVRGDLSRTTSGSGLGLTLAKRVSNLLDGTISLDNLPEGKVLCTIRLPYTRETL